MRLYKFIGMKAALKLSYDLLRQPELLSFALWIWWRWYAKSHSEAFRACLKRSPKNMLSPTQFLRVKKHKQIIDRLASFHPKSPRCLAKTLVLAEWMDKSAISYQFKIGWKEQGLAHVWLIVNGECLDRYEEGAQGCKELLPLIQ